MPVLLTVALYVITSPAPGALDARLASTPAQGSIDDSMCGVNCAGNRRSLHRGFENPVCTYSLVRKQSHALRKLKRTCPSRSLGIRPQPPQHYRPLIETRCWWFHRTGRVLDIELARKAEMKEAARGLTNSAASVGDGGKGGRGIESSLLLMYCGFRVYHLDLNMHLSCHELSRART